MWSQTLLTTSGRGSGSEPTTAASSFDGCNGLIRAGLTFLPDAPLPALAVLAGASLAALTFLSGVLCFVLLGIINLLPMVQTVVGGTSVPGSSTPVPLI